MLIKPISSLDAVIELPGTKSYTQRALLVAGLADGLSRLHGPAHCDDVSYFVHGLRAFGIKLEKDGLDYVVHGSKGDLSAPRAQLELDNNGSAMRFLTAAAALAPGTTRLTGDERGNVRPIEALVKAMAELGARVRCDRNGCPPVLVEGGHFVGGHAKLDATSSSQYLSALLMIAPYADRDVELELLGSLPSTLYVDLTIKVMHDFGIEVKNDNYRNFYVRAGQCYSAQEYDIEADASAAMPFMAAAAIVPGKVRFQKLSMHSKQADVLFSKILERMGCTIDWGEGWLSLAGPEELEPIKVEMSAMPDAVPSLAVVAAFARGDSHIYGMANLRRKESDRITALEAELGKMGIAVESGADEMVIHGGNPKSALIDSHDDHRIAMAFAAAGLKLGLEIARPGCVSKSFPDFFKRLKELESAG